MIALMSYDSGNFHASLVAAVGDDAGLVNDLRTAFIESAERGVDALEHARCADSWKNAAWRLHGLCASFGVINMIGLAREAENGEIGDSRVIRRLRTALAVLKAA